MISFKKEMEKIEVTSPKDCSWFLSDVSRCVLPGFKTRNSKCHCLEGEMDELCVWITKFLKSSPKFELDDELDNIKMPDDLNLSFEIDAEAEKELEKALLEIFKTLPQDNS